MSSRTEAGGSTVRRLLIDAEVLNLDELMREYELDNLDFDLKEWGIYPIHDRGENWVRLADWRKFVRSVLQRVDELIAERGATFVEVPEQYTSEWNDRRTRMLNRNPRLRTLVNAFVERMSEEPRLRWKQNEQTITFFGPDGVKAGLRLRVSGLWLVGSRVLSGTPEKRQAWVRTPDDFDGARQFLVGEWDGEPVEGSDSEEGTGTAQESAPE